MRKTVALALTFVVALIGTPVGVFAAGSKTKQTTVQTTQTGTLTGIARDASQKPLTSAKVQVRSAAGAIVATGSTNGAGEFRFTGLVPGTYTVELIDDRGNIIGISPSSALAAGATATVNVTASAAGAIAAASGGGVGLFGLGKIGTIALIGGAATAAIVGYQLSKGDASPSR